jgi:hypothetical protein
LLASLRSVERRDWLLLLLFALRGAPIPVAGDDVRQGMVALGQAGELPPDQVYDLARADDLDADLESLIAEGLARRPPAGEPATLEVTDAGVERATDLVDEAFQVSPAAVQLLYDVKRDGRAALAQALTARGPRLWSVAGLRRLPRRARQLAGRVLLERRLETSSVAIDAHHFHPERVRYKASQWMWLPRVLEKDEVGPDDVFVDFGSGKGRVVFQAAQYPFRRVVGIEISPALTAIARANIEGNRGRLTCQQIELVTSDVTEFTVPDDMTIAYFFIPFTGSVFNRAIDSIVESIDRRPRRVKLIYVYPLHHQGGVEGEDYVRATGRFEPTPETRRKDYRETQAAHDRELRVAVYVSEPSG